MANPFTMRVIPEGGPFANRFRELKELASHAVNKTDVVLFSPRRYGKTSLARKIQVQLAKDGFLTIYADLFLVTSVDDVAERIAKGIYHVLHEKESLLDKGARFLKTFTSFRPVFNPSATEGFAISVEPVSTEQKGIDLLDRVLAELGAFLQKGDVRAHIVLDEFQEISELKEPRIEGILRKHIQTHPASYLFVGSRRRLLLDMFNQRSRPFYQSAIMYPLEPIPHGDLVAFLIDMFHTGGKTCPKPIAEIISKQSSQYPYYAQSLAYHTFEVALETIAMEDVAAGFDKLIASERYGYESMLKGLTAAQIALLKALAVDSGQRLHTAKYMAKHKLSIGGIQSAQKRLSRLDLIEKNQGIWRIVDPVFAQWLARYQT